MEKRRSTYAEDTTTSAPSDATLYHTGNLKQYLTQNPHELKSGGASIATLLYIRNDDDVDDPRLLNIV